MRRAFRVAVAVSVGFWLDEALRLMYRRSLAAPARRDLPRGPLPAVVPITNRRNHA